MKIVHLIFLPLLVSNWAIMADEDIETYQPAKTPEELDRKTDIHNLPASGDVSSDEMK